VTVCRLGLQDPVPDHSTFSKNRHGRFRESGTFRHVFEAVLQRCMAEGLVKSEGSTLNRHGLVASMSRKGNCFDNAPIESFWGSLKSELVHHRKYATSAEAEAYIREHIEIFYNRQRRQKRLGYQPPAVFAQDYWRTHKAA
jgi:transposase InsO family protein